MLLNLDLPPLICVSLVWKGDLGNDGVPPLFGIKRSTSTTTWAEYVRSWKGLQQHPTKPATPHETSFRQFLILVLQKIVAQESTVLHYLSGHRMGLRFPVEATRNYWRDQDSDEPKGIEAFPLFKKHLAGVLKDAQDMLDQLTQPPILMSAFGAPLSAMNDLCEAITAKYQPEQSAARLKPILGHSWQFLWNHMDEWAVAFSKGQGEKTSSKKVEDLRTAREKWVPGIRQALNHAKAQGMKPPAQVFDPQTLEALFQRIFKEENRKDADHPQRKASHCLDYIDWLCKTHPCPLPEPITLGSILNRPKEEWRALTAAAVKHVPKEHAQTTHDWSSTGINTTIADLLRHPTADLSFKTVYLITLQHKGRIKPGKERRPNDVGRRMNGWRIFLMFLAQTMEGLVLLPQEQVPAELLDLKIGDIGIANWCKSQWGDKEKPKAPEVLPEPQAASPWPPTRETTEADIPDIMKAIREWGRQFSPLGPVTDADYRNLGSGQLMGMSGVPLLCSDEKVKWLVTTSQVYLAHWEEFVGPIPIPVLKALWHRFMTIPV